MTTADELEQGIREDIREWAEDNPDNNDPAYDGSLHELVDGAVPIWTSELFELAAEYPDFRYVDDPGLCDPERGAEGIIAVAIYDWLSERAWDEWHKIQEQREEAEYA